jgi:hypothetical protein
MESKENKKLIGPLLFYDNCFIFIGHHCIIFPAHLTRAALLIFFGKAAFLLLVLNFSHHGARIIVQGGSMFLKRRLLNAAMFCFSILLVACGSENSSTGVSLTQMQSTAIERSSQKISDILTDSSNPGSEESLNEAKAYALSLSNVESAEVTDGNLIVKYKGAGQEVWIMEEAEDTESVDTQETASSTSKGSPSIPSTKQVIGNKKAILINTLHNSLAFPMSGFYFDNMEENLEKAGFEVDRKNNSEVTLDLLKNLAKYSLVVFFSHGGVVLGSNFANTTGVEWNAKKLTKEELQMWENDEIVKVTYAKLEMYGLVIKGSNIGITGNFWKAKYSSHPFYNTLFINCACKSAAANNSFIGQILSIGVTAYTGWTRSTGIGDLSGRELINYLSNGMTLAQAVNALPQNLKIFTSSGNNGEKVTSELKYFPDTAGTTTLIPKWVKKTSETEYSVTGEKNIATYTYDDYGNNVEVRGEFTSGVKWRTEQQFDGSGRIIKALTYQTINGEETLLATTSTTYDSEGRKASEVLQYSGSNVSTTTTYNYNKYNYVSQMTSEMPDIFSDPSTNKITTIQTYEYSYDEFLFPIKKVTYSDGEFFSTTEFSYDESYRLKVEKITTPLFIIMTYYYYDSNNNVWKIESGNMNGVEFTPTSVTINTWMPL